MIDDRPGANLLAFNLDPKLLRGFTLDDLLTKNDLGSVTHSISHCQFKERDIALLPGPGPPISSSRRAETIRVPISFDMKSSLPSWPSGSIGFRQLSTMRHWQPIDNNWQRLHHGLMGRHSLWKP